MADDRLLTDRAGVAHLSAGWAGDDELAVCGARFVPCESPLREVGAPVCEECDRHWTPQSDRDVT